MAQINVTVYQDAMIPELRKIFGGSNNENARKALEAYLAVRTVWEVEVVRKKPFTPDELRLLCDIQNGSVFDASQAASVRMWVASIEDADHYDGIGEKWGVDIPQLIEKVQQIPVLEVYFWREEISRFWDVRSAYGSPSPDLDGFIKKYAGD